jgi:hypothetical protein
MKKFYPSIYALIILFFAEHSFSQTPIVNISKASVASSTALNYHVAGASGSSFSDKSFDYSFGTATQATNNTKTLVDFTIGNNIYTYAQNGNSTVKLRRVDNQEVKGSRTLLWVEQLGSAKSNQVAVVNPYNDNMELAFSSNSLNQGTDNLFANQGDGNGNNNNIERLDVVFQGGLISGSNTKVGFALFERGNDNAHDPFVIAAITGIDVNGNPTTYGNPVRVGSSDYGNLPSSSIDYYVVRRDISKESNLKMSTSGTQNIGGVFLSLEDLGIASTVKIYGYSIFAADLPANAKATDLVNYNNATFFPTNTNSGTQGGIDLIALTGVLSIQNSVILPPTAENIVLPQMLNTATKSTIAPLVAIAASGSIASYSIRTIPTPDQGVLYLCKNGNCTVVAAGKVLTTAEISQLAFQPNNTFVGDVVFYYDAKDTYTQVSNAASYTIPLAGPSLGPLPVKISTFTGSLNGKIAQLNWQTAQEINSSYFELQRSKDGSNFEPIATVTAKGFSGIASNYQCKDDLSYYSDKNAFYRLKMIDIDGKFAYSTIVLLKTEGVVVNRMSIWPNPYIGQLNVNYVAEKEGSVQIKMSSADGKTVLQSNTIVKKGQNVFAISQAQNLPKGTYILNILSDNKTETAKIIKQ